MGRVRVKVARLSLLSIGTSIYKTRHSPIFAEVRPFGSHVSQGRSTRRGRTGFLGCTHVDDSVGQLGLCHPAFSGLKKSAV